MLSEATLTFILVGVLFVVMALATSVLKRLPLTAALLYLAAGYAMGPAFLALIELSPLESSAVLERTTEVAVIVSLFTAGLKLRLPLLQSRKGGGLWQGLSVDWRPALRLAFLSMAITVGLVALIGWGLMGLPLGAAVLLGAILAPTDPVLASDVQVENPTDRDRLRFSLTGEAGLNDGAAFPFVMLGLGLLGLHDLGPAGLRWLGVDLLWAVLAGVATGVVLGTGVGRLVVYLRREHREAVGLDDFLALGLIALAYGVALLLQAYGFLAVFAAGLALRRIERQHSERTGADAPLDVPLDVQAGAASAETEEAIATDPEKAPAYMTQAVLGFNEQLERIGEVVVVVLLGSMLSWLDATWQTLAFVAFLLLVVRPLAVTLGLLGAPLSRVQRRLIAWFGIRGVGSVYYLMYAIHHGLPEELARPMIGLTLAAVAVSIVVHGISVTPLMRYYGRRAA
ncbi:MAG TPA: cation:proton antiporter [Chloroflexota bacterium]|nr:cation:proton antiporter [Chloroflexota bacterium]